jgi:hypothetical protein
MSVLSRMSDEQVVVIELVLGAMVQVPEDVCNSMMVPTAEAEPTCRR